MCADPDNELYLSVVSAWEIVVKHSLGRLALPLPAVRYVPERRAANGIRSLELTEEAVWHAAKLPGLHQDPFDRMLICQAIEHGLTILTPDALIAQYPIRVAW